MEASVIFGVFWKHGDVAEDLWASRENHATNSADFAARPPLKEEVLFNSDRELAVQQLQGGATINY